MNEREAKARWEELGAEHPDRETHRWVSHPGLTRHAAASSGSDFIESAKTVV